MISPFFVILAILFIFVYDNLRTHLFFIKKLAPFCLSGQAQGGNTFDLATSFSHLANLRGKSMGKLLSWLAAPWGCSHRRSGEYRISRAQSYSRDDGRRQGVCRQP